MTTIQFARVMVTAAILFSPIAASAEAPTTIATVAENTVTSTGASTDSKSAPAAAVEKKVCKQLPSSYSRMTQRVCLTEKEWQRVEQEAQD